jgi:glycosyltransferase involved in cell wall biosynthesis
MPPPPLVTVVLPVRNALGTLPRAVASVQAQTGIDWELVAVDDGSQDGSSAWLERAAAADPRVRVVHQPPLGLVPALNCGLQAAQGIYLARMDADDESLPGRLATQAGFLDAHPEIGVVGCLVRFGGDRTVHAGYAAYVDWLNTLVEPEAIAQARFVESPLAHPSVIFRRELVARHGGYAETGEPEDYELWLRWMEAGVRFAKVPQPLLVWHDPPGRLSRTHPHYATDVFYRCKCRYLARWIGRHVAADRPIYLWGAGRVTRRRFAPLAQAGVALAGFIDVDPRKIGGTADQRPVLAVDALPGPGRCFIVAGVGNRQARDQIRHALHVRGYQEMRDFLLAA